jgi:hypothetical protein
VAAITDGKKVFAMKRQVWPRRQPLDVVNLRCCPRHACPLMVAVWILAHGMIGQHLLADNLPALG